MGALRRYSATGMTRETIETNNKDGRCSCEAARSLRKIIEAMVKSVTSVTQVNVNES